MAFEITVDDESLEKFVRQYIETRVNEQIGIFLRHELRGVVEAKLARMNLAKGGVDIENTITEVLSQVIDNRLKKVLPLMMGQEMSRRFSS